MICPNCSGEEFCFLQGEIGTRIFAPDGTEETQYEETFHCHGCDGYFEASDLITAESETIA